MLDKIFYKLSRIFKLTKNCTFILKITEDEFIEQKKLNKKTKRATDIISPSDKKKNKSSGWFTIQTINKHSFILRNHYFHFSFLANPQQIWGLDSICTFKMLNQNKLEVSVEILGISGGIRLLPYFIVFILISNIVLSTLIGIDEVFPFILFSFFLIVISWLIVKRPLTEMYDKLYFEFSDWEEKAIKKRENV